jgi:hypothetical protein
MRQRLAPEFASFKEQAIEKLAFDLIGMPETE